MNTADAITRRRALRQVALGTIGLAIPAVARPARIPRTAEEFRFVVVNDTHYITSECGGYLRGAVALMKQAQPDFVLHLGDLTEHGQREHLEAVKAIFGELGVPWYPVPGNHDYLSMTDRSAYDAVFPNRLNYWFRHCGWQFVALDSTEGTRYEETSLNPATLQFARRGAQKLDPRQPTVLFTHFPFGPSVNYRPAGTDEVLSDFAAFDLRAVLSGHWHADTARRIDELLLTTGRCCALKRNNHDGSKAKGFVVCTAAHGRLHRRFVEYKAA